MEQIKAPKAKLAALQKKSETSVSEVVPRSGKN